MLYTSMQCHCRIMQIIQVLVETYFLFHNDTVGMHFQAYVIKSTFFYLSTTFYRLSVSMQSSQYG